MFNNIAEAFEKARLDSYIMSFAADNSDKQAKIDKLLQTKAKVIFEHKHELQQVFDMLSDHTSKQQYFNYLIYRILSNIDNGKALQNNPNMPLSRFQYYLSNIGQMIAANGLVPPTLNVPVHYRLEMLYELLCTFAIQQYAYPNYVDVTKDDVFLDCGSFIGDTVIWALQKGAQVYAFEPIEENMGMLKRNLRENGYSDQHCYQLGLSNTNQSLNFTLPPILINSALLHSGNETAEDLSILQQNCLNEGKVINRKIQCVRLSDWCADNNVQATFIKMDIEGAELDALRGAEELIKSNKPKLAICLYHHVHDLWTIPLYVKSLVPEYKLFCRENRTSTEFVMYATV